jgi:hypothetical protein
MRYIRQYDTRPKKPKYKTIKHNSILIKNRIYNALYICGKYTLYYYFICMLLSTLLYTLIGIHFNIQMAIIFCITGGVLGLCFGIITSIIFFKIMKVRRRSSIYNIV